MFYRWDIRSSRPRAQRLTIGFDTRVKAIFFPLITQIVIHQKDLNRSVSLRHDTELACGVVCLIWGPLTRAYYVFSLFTDNEQSHQTALRKYSRLSVKGERANVYISLKDLQRNRSECLLPQTFAQHSNQRLENYEQSLSPLGEEKYPKVRSIGTEVSRTWL